MMETSKISRETFNKVSKNIYNSTVTLQGKATVDIHLVYILKTFKFIKIMHIYFNLYSSSLFNAFSFSLLIDIFFPYFEKDTLRKFFERMDFFLIKELKNFVNILSFLKNVLNDAHSSL